MRRRGLLALLLALAVAGCSSPATAPPADLAPLLADAWARYETGDYAGAAARFASAGGTSAEAEAGRGLALARLRRYDEAAASFRAALGRAPGALDALAGLALAEAARDAHAAVVDPATRLLVLEPRYRHPHDASVDARAVRLVRAQAYCRAGDLGRAAADLDLLDPEGAPHSTDPQALLAALAAASGFGPGL
jgi:tetratricopeptide (TPR) repeat protein